MVIFQRQNIRTDWNVCINHECVENTAWLQQSQLDCLKLSHLIKALCFSVFPWEQFALDREQRRCGGGGQWGRQRAGRQQVMCLPPECLLNASTCSVSVDLWPCHRRPGSPAGRGSEGTVVPCTAGQLVLLRPCHPPAERQSYTQIYSVFTHTPSCTHSWPDKQHRCPCRTTMSALMHPWASLKTYSSGEAQAGSRRT